MKLIGAAKRMLSSVTNLTLVVGVLVISSCDPQKKLDKNYLYFQDSKHSVVQPPLQELTIQPNDLLQILIYTKSINQQQAELFNITAKDGYVVALNGNIEVPVIGPVKAAGLTRFQLQDAIKEKLIPYVKDPSVAVRFQQFAVTVLGEVRVPGLKPFPTDKVTIIDAISAAGDLSESAARQDILVSREDENGVRIFHKVDLRSIDIFKSPVYQLQQNDIIYVNANEKKLKSLKEKKNTTQGLQLGLSLLSTLAALYFALSQ